MVAKISHGASLYGALAYNHNKVATGAAGILSGNRMISDRLGLPSEDMRLALLSFENYLLANRNTEKPVLHISLSPAPEDRLTDDQLVELADRYMRKMGYGDQPYIAYKHADTHNTHIHIVSVCVDEQGKKISDSYEHRRSMTACRELEADFGLRNGADTEKRNPKAELKKVDASLGDVRHQIGNTLKAVLESYRFQTFGEYSALLSTLNIEAKQVRGEYHGVPYTGIVYAATDDAGKVVSPPFKSSRFGKRFGNEQLEKRMLLNLKALKEGEWAPSIQADIARALQQADSRQRFVELLGQKRIGVVFRENEQGASTASPSLTTTAGRCSTAHAWARSFPQTCSTTISGGWTASLKTTGTDIRQRNSGSITGTRRARKARSSRRRVSSPWKPTRGITRRRLSHAV